MTNLDKYNRIFMREFNRKEEELHELRYRGISLWDSVGHMELIADLEELFEIQMETPDVLDFTSYEKGKEVLEKYGVRL